MQDSEIFNELARLIRQQLDPDDMDEEVKKAIGKEKGGLSLTVLVPLTLPPDQKDGAVWHSLMTLRDDLDRIARGSSTFETTLNHSTVDGTWKGESERCCLPKIAVSMQDWEKLVKLLPEALRQLQKSLLQEAIAFIICEPGKNLVNEQLFIFDGQENDWHEIRRKKWRYQSAKKEDSVVLERLQIGSQGGNALSKGDGDDTLSMRQAARLVVEMQKLNNDVGDDASRTSREELAAMRDVLHQSQHEANELAAKLVDLRGKTSLSVKGSSPLSCSELSNLLDQASRCKDVEKRLDALNSIKKLLDESSDDSTLCKVLRARCNAELMDSWEAIEVLQELGVDR